jgi:hypothetical protein
VHAQGWGTSYEIAAAIYYCANTSGVKVINLSVGGPEASQVEYDALKYATLTKNILVVAAAGNDSSGALSFPAAWADQRIGQQKVSGTYWDTAPANEIYSRMISVAAARQDPSPIPVWVDINGDGSHDSNEMFTSNDCAATFSNYGATVTLVAPGSDVYSTTPTSYPFYLNYYNGISAGYDFMSGSSQAAAYTSAAVVRVMSIKLPAPASLQPTYSATPHNLTGLEVKQQFIDKGRDLTFAVAAIDEGTAFDPTKGYNNDPGWGLITDDPFYANIYPNGYIKAPYCWPDSVDTKDSGLKNPFVTTGGQPGYDANNYKYDMSGNDSGNTATKYLDLAAAMDRMIVSASAVDAQGNMPLSGATISIRSSTYASTYVPGAKPTSSSASYDSAMVSSGTPTVLLMNVPRTLSGANPQYELLVNKAGYTSGAQLYNFFPMSDSNSVFDPKTAILTNNYNGVSVPSAANISVVLDWLAPKTSSIGGSYPFDQIYADMDLYLWLPQNATVSYVQKAPLPTISHVAQGVVGPGLLVNTTDANGNRMNGYRHNLLYNDPPYPTDPPTGSPIYDWAIGAIMDPVKVNPAWTTAIAKAWPYAQMDSNGGSSFLGGGPFTHDSITIRPRPSGAVNPWFSQDFNPKIPTSTDTLNYAILVTDYSQKYSDGSFGGATNPFPATDAGGALVAPNTVPFDSHLDASTHDQFTYPVVRVWYKGILQGTAKLTDVNSGDGCDSGNDMWFVGTLRDTVQPNALRT